MTPITYRWIILISLMSLTSCSTQEFASDTGQTRDAVRKPPPKTDPPGTPPLTPTPPVTGTPVNPVLNNDGGGNSATIPGIQAKKIGVSFEDGTDNDYNDVSVCFDAPFKVDASRPGLPPKVVMAEPKGQKVKVYLKSLTGNVPTVTIRILDSTDKVIFEKIKVYTRKANSNTENPVGPFFEEQFPFGSRLYVQFNWGRNQLNTEGPGKVKVERDICRNTGS
jgi:hypothetical protein